MEGGADISAIDRFGSTVLDEAVRVGAIAVAAYMTDVGAATAKADERTAKFLNAAAAGDTDLLRFMLANGEGEKKKKKKTAWSPQNVPDPLTLPGTSLSAPAAVAVQVAALILLLYTHISLDFSRAFSLLLPHDSPLPGQPPASADYDQRSGLMLSVGGGHFSAVTTLLGAGAPADAVDAFGGSALTEAIKLRRKDMVDLLVSAGAKLDWPVDRASGTLCQAATEGDTGLIEMYAAAGVDVNAGDYDARRAIHIAAADGQVGALKALIGAGADVNAVDRWSATPMLEAIKAVAAGKADPTLVDLMKAVGGHLVVGTTELSGILCAAVQAKDIALLELYLRAGADASAGDYDAR